MKRTLIFLMCMGLTACFSFNSKPQVSQPNDVPLAYKYTNQAHPLGRGQYPSAHDGAYAVLLLGEVDMQGNTQNALRAQQACRALFTDTSLESPQQEANQIATYLPVKQLGDFTLVSTRFKWGMCSRINKWLDKEREEHFLARIGYVHTKGPVLIAIDEPYRKQETDTPIPAIVADLSMVPAHEIAIVVQNWLQAASVLNPKSDLDEVAEHLNRGLESRRVAISRMPELIEKGIAAR